MAEIETPLEGLPVDVPGRSYALVQVTVSEVVGRQGTVAPGGNPLPAITAGEVVPLVAYHDLTNTPLGEMQRLRESGDEVLLLLAGMGNAADPGWQGLWMLTRVVEVVDGTPSVRGLCEDQVNVAMSQVAGAVGRPSARLGIHRRPAARRPGLMPFHRRRPGLSPSPTRGSAGERWPRSGSAT